MPYSIHPLKIEFSSAFPLICTFPFYPLPCACPCPKNSMDFRIYLYFSRVGALHIAPHNFVYQEVCTSSNRRNPTRGVLESALGRLKLKVGFDSARTYKFLGFQHSRV